MVGSCLELSTGVVSKFGEIATETKKTTAIAAILMPFFKGILLQKKTLQRFNGDGQHREQKKQYTADGGEENKNSGEKECGQAPPND